MNSENSKHLFVYSVVLFFVFSFGMCKFQPGKLVENPQPTHYEKTFSQMEEIKRINPDFDKDHFFAKITSLAVDDKGNLYCYDKVLKKIFKFNPNFEHVTSFGQQGRGPGEFSGIDLGYMKINITPNNQLAVINHGDRRISLFDLNGKHLRDQKLPAVNSSPSLPVFDKSGNYFVVLNSGTIKMLDENNKILSTYLNKDDFDQFVMYEPEVPPGFPDMRWLPNEFNTFIDMAYEGSFFIYLSNSSTFFHFRDSKLIKKMNIWPEIAMDAHRRSTEELDRKTKAKGFKNEVYAHLMDAFFIDKDDAHTFYLNGRQSETGQRWVYKFCIDGNLEKVLLSPKPVRIYVKRNGLFYGISGEDILILKEKK